MFIRQKRLWIVVLLFIFVMGIASHFANRTIRVNETDVPGFEPFIDDAFAQKYCPAIISNDRYEYPYTVHYRASIDKNGNRHIAYHFFWEREINQTQGFVPWLSRNIYTGGIKLQRIMFGKHDIEVIGMIIDKTGRIKKVIYESPDNYNPYDFVVKHKTNEQAVNDYPPLRFKVVSWNHLFEFVGNDYTLQQGELELIIKPRYFTQSLWEEFTMFKKEETALKRNRAHFVWAREYID